MNAPDQPKFWNTRFQEWLTIGEVEYRRILARDQEVLVRETSASKWQDFFRTVVAQ